MANFETTGKLAYMYDESTDTWHVIAGASNTALSYNWTGTNTFDGVVIMTDVFTSEAGVNNFQNPSVRDAVLENPVNGSIAFVRQDSQGNPINQLQYHSSGNWHSVSSQASLITKTSNHTLQIEDSGKTILMNSSSNNELEIPTNASVPFSIGDSISIVQYGVGTTTITAPYGVILNSLNSHRDISGQYGKATVTKTATNTWLLYGDITT